jgi:hypothetical protein
VEGFKFWVVARCHYPLRFKGMIPGVVMLIHKTPSRAGRVAGRKQAGRDVWFPGLTLTFDMDEQA